MTRIWSNNDVLGFKTHEPDHMVILNFSVVTFTLHSLPSWQFGRKYFVVETEYLRGHLEKQAEKKNVICNMFIMLFIIRKIRKLLNILN